MTNIKSNNNNSIIPHQFNKTNQCQYWWWDSVAKGYRKWWKQIEENRNGGLEVGAKKVSNKLLELAEIRQGDHVLDIATGYGEPAITAAQYVGSYGNVLAIDISPQMLEIAKERSILLGLKNIEFKEANAERLYDYLPQSFFDVALCRWGLMLLSNLNTVLKNIHSSLLPGGRFAAAVWSHPSKVPLISLAMNTVREHLKMPTLLQLTSSSAAAAIPGPFSLANVNTLVNSFIQAGFTGVHTESLTVSFELASAEDYVCCTKELSAPINAILSNEVEERKEEIWKAVAEEAARKYTDNTTGCIRLDNEVICIVGKKNEKE
ncbi:MAG: methyltransferase domain-containing protein [Thermoproteota archaeon]|nr:methyltransferase domain-containing protein [Thermoproteota archaeon]